MPIHDWTRVPAGIFHDFHLAWIAAIRTALNGGVLPDNLYALAEARTGGAEADVLALERKGEADEAEEAAGFDPPVPWSPEAEDRRGGVAVAERPPRFQVEETVAEVAFSARKQRRLVVRHVSGDRIVALLEIASPGNTDSRAAARQFVEKAAGAVMGGHHLSLIDLFPPGPQDPGGLHGAIWADLGGTPYVPPPDRPLSLAAYRAADGATCYVEPTAVGRELVDLPLFFSPERYVNVPLAATYASAFAGVPRHLRARLEAAAAE